jgi:hypothetical protein
MADTSLYEKAQVSKLIGCYATNDEEGVLLELSENQGKYSASLYDSGNKIETIEMHVGNEIELGTNYLFSHDEISHIKTNLIADDVAFGVLLVNPGARLAGKTAKTDYFGVLIMGTASLNKIPCK